MRRVDLLWPVIMACALCVAPAVRSPVQAGEYAEAFDVYDCTGPAKGKSLCYRCRYGARPAVAVFVHSVSDQLASLVKQLDEQVAARADAQLAAFVVLLTEDPEADEARLQELATRHEIKHVPLTLFDGVVGPEGYKLDEEAELTVVMWKNQEIEVKRPYAPGKFEEASIKDVLGDVESMLK